MSKAEGFSIQSDSPWCSFFSPALIRFYRSARGVYFNHEVLVTPGLIGQNFTGRSNRSEATYYTFKLLSPTNDLDFWSLALLHGSHQLPYCCLIVKLSQAKSGLRSENLLNFSPISLNGCEMLQLICAPENRSTPILVFVTENCPFGAAFLTPWVAILIYKRSNP